jgi:hypothetical protein
MMQYIGLMGILFKTVQSSFFCAFPTSNTENKDKEKPNTTKMTLRSISQVNVNAKDAKLPSVQKHTKKYHIQI